MQKIDIEESFSLGKTLAEIEAHMASAYEVAPQTPKDFYNFLDGTVTCGRCGKKMGSFRALFHFHFK